MFHDLKVVFYHCCVFMLRIVNDCFVGDIDSPLTESQGQVQLTLSCCVIVDCVALCCVLCVSLA